jgi:hypothetical protein
MDTRAERRFLAADKEPAGPGTQVRAALFFFLARYNV